MTSKKVHHGSVAAKRGWTVFELFLLTPFAFLLWLIATEPLVVPMKKEVAPPLAVAVAPAAPAPETGVATGPEKQVAESVTTPDPSAEPARVVFVANGSTSVLQRIAPVASVNIAATEPAPAVAADSTPAVVAAAPVEAPPVRVHVVPVSTAASSLRIEISDGTGVEGFAKDVAQQLEQAGMTVSATDAITSTQKRNVILFRDGFEEDAVRLSMLFVRPPALVNNTNTRKPSDTADVRLILGNAATREKSLFASKGGAPKL